MIGRISIVGVLSLLYPVICQAADLSCSDAARLIVGHQFSVVGNSSRGWSGAFTATSATCNGVLSEGKRAQARLTVNAGSAPDRDSGSFGGPPRGIDPFTEKGDYVPLGTPFEFNGVAFYALYDTGWKLESFKPASGRRLYTKAEEAYRNMRAPADLPPCTVEGDIIISIGGHRVFTGTQVAVVSKGSSPGTYRVQLRDIYGFHDGDVDGRLLRCPPVVWQRMNASMPRSSPPPVIPPTSPSPHVETPAATSSRNVDTPPKRDRVRKKGGYEYRLE